MDEQKRDDKVARALGALGILIAIIALIVASLGVIWSRDNSGKIETLQEIQSSEVSAEEIPTEPSNPNVTGGTSGAGTGTANDTSIETPSPAGGVDADGNLVQ